MKKIISIVLVLVCAFALFSCGKEDPTAIALKEINDMYNAISPSKIETVTTEEFGDYTLMSTSTLQMGTIDDSTATVYVCKNQKLRDVKSGSGSEVLDVIEDLGTVTKEYHEEYGLRENGGKWDIDGENFAPKTGDIALKLTTQTVKDFVVDAKNKSYTFVVTAENTEAVFGHAISSDVSVKITSSGADITGVLLTYTIIDENEEDNAEYPEIKVTVEAKYSYGNENITINVK